ncbi:uncharacterized protein METZ01_LOCUS325740, partial [marine metagenome]
PLFWMSVRETLSEPPQAIRANAKNPSMTFFKAAYSFPYTTLSVFLICLNIPPKPHSPLNIDSDRKDLVKRR